MIKQKQDYYDIVYRLTKYQPSCKEDFNDLIELIDEFYSNKKYIYNVKQYLRNKCKHIAEVSKVGKTADYMKYLLGHYYLKDKASWR